MRRLFVTAVIALAIAVASYLLLQRADGYVLLAVSDYTIEMPFVVAVLLNVAFVLLLYLLVSLCRWLLKTRSNVVSWAVSQRRQKGLNRTAQGLVAFVEGRWDNARRSLAKAADNSSTPLVNYLFAARASSAIGDAKAVDGFLKQAELSTQGGDVAIGLTQAELQIQNGQFEQALATLLRVKKQVSGHPVVLRLLARVYGKLNDWQSLIKLLPSFNRSVMSDTELARLEQLACNELLKKAASSRGYEALADCWKHLPANARKRPIIVATYAEQLVALNRLDSAEQLLRNQLHRLYDTQLIEIYGRTLADKPEKQLAYAEKLLKSHAADTELLIALGRICLRMDKLDAAADYFLKSLASKEQAVTFAELGNLYAIQGDYKKSARYYAKGAALQAGRGGLLPAAPV